MTVSVCVPTRHRPDLLLETIRSCTTQTVAPSEIVIGDDSDDDRTENLIETLRRISIIPICYQRHRPPLGQSRNVQRLFEAAISDWLLLIHDDDWLLPNAIQDLTAPLYRDSSLDAVFGKQYLASADGRIDQAGGDAFNKVFHRTEQDAGPLPQSIRSAVIGQFPNNGYLVRRELAVRVGYHDPALNDGCDYGFGVALAASGGRFYFTNRYTAVYRMSGASITRGRMDTCSVDMARTNRQVRHLLDSRDRDLRAKVRADLYRAVVWSGLARQRRLETLGWALDPVWGLRWWEGVLALSALLAPRARQQFRAIVKAALPRSA